jgi:hypothetical protein
MKKMILLSMFALGAWTINAQTPVIESGGFWENWSMGLQGGWHDENEWHRILQERSSGFRIDIWQAMDSYLGDGYTGNGICKYNPK